jgi:CRP/FNR family transcriptional regulator, cyclic AMP receptor protein
VKVIGLFKNAQRILEAPSGTVIFNEGDLGEEMYGIVEGGIELHTRNRNVAALGVDDIFGEMSLIDKSPRSATAITTSDTVLAVIDRQRFLFLVQETPLFALAVMSTMAERFRIEG